MFRGRRNYLSLKFGHFFFFKMVLPDNDDQFLILFVCFVLFFVCLSLTKKKASMPSFKMSRSDYLL